MGRKELPESFVTAEDEGVFSVRDYPNAGRIPPKSIVQRPMLKPNKNLKEDQRPMLKPNKNLKEDQRQNQNENQTKIQTKI